MNSNSCAPEKIILHPDVIGLSFFDPVCLEVLKHWRDGKILPVVSRDLLQNYFKLLHSLGIPQFLIRRWGWCFTAIEKSLYLKQDTFMYTELSDLYSYLAIHNRVRFIIAVRFGVHPEKEVELKKHNISLITPSEYLSGRISQ